MSGAVYDLEPFNGKLLAAVNSKAQVFYFSKMALLSFSNQGFVAFLLA